MQKPHLIHIPLEICTTKKPTNKSKPLLIIIKISTITTSISNINPSQPSLIIFSLYPLLILTKFQTYQITDNNSPYLIILKDYIPITGNTPSVASSKSNNQNKNFNKKTPPINLSPHQNNLLKAKKKSTKLKNLTVLPSSNYQSLSRTFYKNFREDSSFPIRKTSQNQNDETLKILSQRLIKAKKYDIQRSKNKTSRNYDHQSSPDFQQKSPQHAQKHFFNTISYGEKFISLNNSPQKFKQASKLLKTSREKQTTKNHSFFQMIPHYTSYQNTDTFLKIQRCVIEKKDQNFVKQCYNFKQILLKQKQKRQKKKNQSNKEAELLKLINKNKRSPSFFNSENSHKNENKYVSEMREKKKIKKTFGSYEKADDESPANKIQPW